MKPWRAALVGFGSWGERVWQALERHPFFEVQWIAETEDAKARHIEETLNLPTAKSLHQGLDKITPHVVFLASPVESHLELALAALRKGCAVWITKPLVRTSFELRQVVEEAHRQNRPLFFDHTFRWNPRFQFLQDTLKTLPPAQIWRSRRTHRGGWQKDSSALEELIYHDLSMLWALGWTHETYLKCWTENQLTQLELHFQREGPQRGGLQALMQASLDIDFRERRVELEGPGWHLVWNELSPDRPLSFVRSPWGPIQLEVPKSSREALDLQLDEIHEVLSSKATPRVTEVEASWIMGIIESARLSK